MPIDDLTGLQDRKSLFACITQEINRKKRTDQPVTLLVIDIDRFKEINDSYGHVRGDLILMEVAELIKKGCRTMDIACRYGGDEFIVILPEADRSIGELVSQRILLSVEQYVFRGSEGQSDLKLTVSIGIAECPTSETTVEKFIDRGDRALYLAKKSGRARFARDLDVTDKITAGELNFNVFIDRAGELDQLKQRFSSVLNRQGSFVVVAGEAGIGKTRLVNEWMALSYVHKPLNLYGRPFDFGVTPPYHIFFQAIKEAVVQHAVALVGAIPVAYRSQLAKFLPELSAKLAAQELAPSLSPDHEKMRLFDAVLRVFEYLAQKQPVFLFLDDMQWVREPDLELLGYLVRNSVSLPIIICIAYRQEEIDNKHPLALFLRTLSRESLYSTLELKEFDSSDTAKKLNTIFDAKVPEELSVMVSNVTRGNPFYIEEVVKSLVDKGDIYWDSTWMFQPVRQVEVPRSINDLLGRRFDGMEEELIETLTMASAVGSHFPLLLLQRLTGKNEGHLLQLLDKGVRNRIVVEESNDTYGFVNFFLSRMLYQGLSPVRQRRLHQQIGQTIEVLYADRLSQFYELLVHHYRLAEDWSKVFEYSLKAGRKLKELFANKEAIVHFKTCLQLIKDGRITKPDEEKDIYLYLGELHTLISDFSEALNYYEYLLKKDDLGADDRISMLAALLNIYTLNNDFEKGLLTYETAKEYFNQVKDQVTIARFNGHLIWFYNQHGEYAKAIDLAFSTLPALKEANEPKDYLRVLNMVGSIYADQGDLANAELYYKQCLDYKLDGGGFQNKMGMMNNLANVYARRNDLVKANEYYQQCLEIAEKCGSRFDASVCLCNIGNLNYEQDNWPTALVYYQKSMNIAGRINALHVVMMDLINTGEILSLMGDLDKACENLLKGLDLSEKTSRPREMVLALNNLETVYLNKSDLPAARESGERARDICNKHDIKDSVCISLANLALVYQKMEMDDKALAAADLALVQSKELDFLEGQVGSYLALGEIFMSQNRIEKAATVLNKALEIAKSLKKNYMIGQCCLALGVLKAKSHDRKAAHDLIREAREKFEKLGAKIMFSQADDELKKSDP